jgi:hypothetical protein
MVGYEIVAGTSAFVGLVLLYGYSVFYKFVIDRQKEIEKMVEKDLATELKSYKQILKDFTPKAFVETLQMYTHFEELVQNTKEYFERDLLFTSLIIVIASFAYVFYQGTENSTTAWNIGILGTVFLLYRLNSLRINKGEAERYLSGEPVEDILEEEG